MGWLSLGVLTLADDWQSFPEVAGNTQTFRLTHYTTIQNTNSCWLAQYFPAPDEGGRLSPWRRIRPSREPVILLLPVPVDLLDQDFFVRTIQLKKRKPYYPYEWRIKLEALY